MTILGFIDKTTIVFSVAFVDMLKSSPECRAAHREVRVKWEQQEDIEKFD